jgi:hypothetical protein
MKKRFIATFIVALAWPLPSLATEKNAPPAPSQTGAGDVVLNKMIRSESQQPMNMNQPMPTGMARKGMKKGDVKAHATKKEVFMHEKMKQEEMKK